MKLCKRQNQKLLTSFVFVSGELKEEHSNVGNRAEKANGNV